VNLADLQMILEEYPGDDLDNMVCRMKAALSQTQKLNRSDFKHLGIGENWIGDIKYRLYKEGLAVGNADQAGQIICISQASQHRLRREGYPG